MKNVCEKIKKKLLAHRETSGKLMTTTVDEIISQYNGLIYRTRARNVIKGPADIYPNPPHYSVIIFLVPHGRYYGQYTAVFFCCAPFPAT